MISAEPSSLPPSGEDLRDAWPVLSSEERVEAFLLLDRAEAQEFFLELGACDHATIVLGLPLTQRRLWMRLLAPDDAADLIQKAPEAEREGLLALLEAAARQEVKALLAFAEDDAGGLMNPRFARVRPDMRVDEAISYIRKQAMTKLATVYYVYVTDAVQHLLGEVSFRELFAAKPDQTVRDVMATDLVHVTTTTDQEEVGRLFAKYDLLALPVVDEEGRIQGVVTVDDVIDVVSEEATEDIQKFGGMEALGAPYLSVRLGSMIRKRAGWLAALFLGEMLTATAMGFFAGQIAKAVILALFVPLIISSGGNSGSQASTLVIRAMALGEVRLRDWWRVVGREILAGVALGSVLGSIGIVRIVTWQAAFGTYGAHYGLIAATVGLALVGVVTFGTIAGSMLPFVLRRLGFDPASASAPFVATLVDVTGLIIYFTVASLVLSGTLL